MIDNAPPGPIKTRWGLAFRDYDDCMRYIRESNSLKAPPGGVALPLFWARALADLITSLVREWLRTPWLLVLIVAGRL